MAGTDRTRAPVLGGPAIILVEPQMGENIGAAARAMLNFGLTDLRLVRPRDGWPNEKAEAMAAGARAVLDGVRLFDTTAAAVADLQRVYATTARARDMLKPVVGPRQAAADMRAALARQEACGILFGGERAGLGNDDVVLADTILTVPLNPAFASLNLGQAVLLVAYEWFQAGEGARPMDAPAVLPRDGVRPATKQELTRLFEHFEAALDEAGYFDRTPDRRPVQVRNLRNLLQRANLLDADIHALHGILKGLAAPWRNGGGPEGDPGDDDGGRSS
jgi:tRNA/rRNA methyltransferase